MKHTLAVLDKLLHPPKWALLTLPEQRCYRRTAWLLFALNIPMGSPILSAAKVLNFVAALMSLLGLQTAMLSQFSTEGERFCRRMNAITGGGVWFAVIWIAVYMLLHSRKKKEVRAFEPLGE